MFGIFANLFASAVNAVVYIDNGEHINLFFCGFSLGVGLMFVFVELKYRR